MLAAVGSFGFAAIEQAIKKPLVVELMRQVTNLSYLCVFLS